MPTIPSDQAADLPDTLDELLEAIEMGHATDEGLRPLSYHFAASLDSVRECDVCHRPIVDADVMATTLAEHYGTDDRQRIEDVLRSSELETGDTLSPNYYSFHAQITSE
ncbi:MAG: hypothetical protein O2888_00890 [Chloroflexi bacterium]|nr:hypothetical protein [Chloroflexota bacterium]